MSNFSDQIEQIKTLISSNSKPDKSYAYSTLHHLQEQASSDDSLIKSFVDSSETFLSSIVADIHEYDSDEEIVALALKCLGFMIYHPYIVAAIPKQCMNDVLESLAKLITTTKIKVVCNLGVWCISMQQLDTSSLTLHFDSLLRAVVHSLDNPFGSLSTTFEGIQAIMKLGTQLSEKMRDTSNIWAPPIYRRLLSADKREREMCQRCLLKIKSLIIPPQKVVSKAIALEMKLKLLPAMKEMLKQDKKVQTLLAWRWYICILGYHSLKSRHLVNELLKVPEQTFSDSDPQVQIATLVAWEGLIDALVSLPSKVGDVMITNRLPIEQDIKVRSLVASEVNGSAILAGGYLKGLKLIMTPINGIMASKTDCSVQSSCLNTWYYLLHKLDSLVNDPSILDLVVEPMFKAVFSVKLDDSNFWIWRVCMNLLLDFIQVKSLDNGSHADGACYSSPRRGGNIGPLLGDNTLKTYSVKWLPWDCSQMDFLVRMMQMTPSQASLATLSSENNNLIYDVIIRMFSSFLKGVQIDLAKSSTSYDTIMQSINGIFGLVKTLCEATRCVDGESKALQITCLRSLEAIVQELDLSILGSPLYKIPLDVEFVCQGEARCKTLASNVSMSYMDMVPPVTYLTVLYYYMVIQMRRKEGSHDTTQQNACSYLNRVLSSYDSLDVLHAIAASLYASINGSSLGVWLTVAHCLRDNLCGAKDLLPLKIQPTSSGSNTLCNFLIYPLVVYSCCKSMGTAKECESSTSPIISENSEVEVADVWLTLYNYVSSTILQEVPRKNWFTEDFCSSLNDFLYQLSNLSEGICVINGKDNSSEHQLWSLCSDIGTCILENLNIEKVSPEAISKSNFTGSSGISNCLEFIARLMNLVWTKLEEPSKSVLISRLLPPLIRVAGHLQWKDDITSFLEVFGGPMLIWISDVVMNSEHIKDQLSLLWAEVIRSLQRSWPSIDFDSSFLDLQAPLLEKALDHPYPSISDPTISFWNSAYGDEPRVNFPSSLLHVLDKLSQLGKIKTKNNLSSRVDNDPPSHKVTSTLNKCSKRVELVGNTSELPPCPKRKRPELTEHQREVRRAQQGKARDCSGHGPGIRTYTSLDFSQGNEDSQDSQDIRDSEMILDLLKRA